MNVQYMSRRDATLHSIVDQKVNLSGVDETISYLSVGIIGGFAGMQQCNLTEAQKKPNPFHFFKTHETAISSGLSSKSF